MRPRRRHRRRPPHRARHGPRPHRLRHEGHKGSAAHVPAARPGILDKIDGISDVLIAGTSVSMLWSGTGIPQAAIAAIEATGATVSNIRTSSPGLEDVFLALTGRDMRQEA